MDYNPPAGPPPGYRQSVPLASNNPCRNANSKTESTEGLKPPTGPTPSLSSKDLVYQPPPGPPPSFNDNEEPGPPPYDPWMAIPDNALLPPPPAMRDQFSPANNASWSDAERAENWCRQNELWGPRTWSTEQLEHIDSHHFTLSAPPGTKDMIIAPVEQVRTSLKTSKRQGDVTILSNLPLLAPLQLPLRPGQAKTIYFEVAIKHMSGSDASVAIGFVAPPFPPNRLPGWHRGSLAVHNDDGHRFVNDDEGGIEFVRPFGARDRIGLGITYIGSQFQDQLARAQVFFTRNGQQENSWDLHESRDIDAQEGGVLGLDGSTDLYAAIGICGGVELEVIWET